MPRLLPGVAAAALLLCLGPLLSPGRLWAVSPALAGISPRGGQRGKELALVLRGARLSDAKELLLYYPGVLVEKLEVVNDAQVKATVKIAADCRLGEHALRVRTATGISELRTFHVGALPEVEEKEPNGDFSAPQRIPLDVTVTGVVQSEDLDLYAFEAKKGQRVSAEVEGMRLGSALFDPHLSILDARRFELSTSDDSPLVWQDAVASVVIPEDGVYVAQVRESAYGGNDGCHYRLHLGAFPRPLAVLPAGGKAGEEVEVTFLGDPAGPLRQKLKLPAEPGASFAVFAQDGGGIAPSPMAFRVSEVGNVLEVEPNDDQSKATPAELPLALNGAIQASGDIDFFRFKAKKGETFDVHLHARRIRSPLDPVLAIYPLGGAAIARNDDAVGPDSHLRFTVPEDREYALRVKDHLGKGGPHYTYRVEFTPVRPRLSLSIPKVALYSQERQTIPVPRGNRFATLLSASRVDFGGDLVLEAEGLPAGVNLSADTMASNVDAVPVVFEAAADAPPAGALVRLAARHADPAQKVRGGFSQVVELVTGGPGQSVYWKHEVDRAAVAVTEEAPFRISIVEPRVPLVQNGSLNLKVVAERKGDFKAPIAIQMVFNPPGVGSAGGVSIPEGQSEALILINANGGAPPRAWKIAVSGTATVKDGPLSVSSQLATLVIAAPYLALQVEKASAEQGKETEVFAKIEHKTPFKGLARVQLLGLPARVTAPDLEITSESKELAFKVKVDPASPPGQHKGLFCLLTIVDNGEPIVHSLGATELRIDVPLPPRADQAPPPPAPVAAQKPPEAARPPEKRLTRLEKLRLEEEERRKAAGAGSGVKK